jgi:hypothetical protein
LANTGGTTAAGNTLYGVSSGVILSGTGNVAVGISSGQNVTGNSNVSVGDSAGESIVGSTNTGLGTLSSSTISGGYNAGSGFGSSRAISGDSNTGMGSLSSVNVTGYFNSGLGTQSSINVVGYGNTAAGASSGQSVTGSSNSALGIGAGQSVTGNANIAIGQNAGSAGALTTTATINTELASQSKAIQVKTEDVVVPSALPIQGDNNVAIGTNAGLGNGNQFSDTVALGTNASAQQSQAVAIGANTTAAGISALALGSGASAIADNSVALGAGSIANAPNTVSVGSVGSQRRIVNVAPGVNASDAATFGQVDSVARQAQSGISIADRGVAMALAGAGATNASAKPGETAIAMGTGYFEGNTALGVGVASASIDGDRVLRVGSAISPGLADVTLQASYQMRVGRASGAIKNTGGTVQDAQVHQALPIPFSIWNRHGFKRVMQLVPGRLYTVFHGTRQFRLAIADSVTESGTAWGVQVDEMLRDGQWRHIPEMDKVDANPNMKLALSSIIEALDAYAKE